MKRNTYLVLMLAGLLALVVAGITSSAQNWKTTELRLRQADEKEIDSPIPPLSTPTPDEPKADALPERYEASNVLQLEYGEGEKQAGLITGVEDFRPTGPLSFAVKGEAIYVLDEINDQVKAFNRAGDLIRAVEVDQGSSDIAVDAQDRLYVLNSTTNSIAGYEVGSLSAKRQAVGQPVASLSADSKDVVSAKLRNSYSYELDQWSGKVGRQASGEAFTCIRDSDRAGRVINNANGQTINITTGNSLGSISYLGTDREGNIYIVVEELLSGDTVDVRKEVRKYSAYGSQLAAIPVNIDYVAHPEKELILEEDGTVYHLLPLKDHLVVEKWVRTF